MAQSSGIEPGHLLEIDTRNKIFKLDGVSFAECATSCSIDISAGALPKVTIELYADIDIKDVATLQVNERTKQLSI